MRYATVEGSLEWAQSVRRAPQDQQTVRQSEVEAEARRRKAALRIDEWQMREYVTGRPVPEEVRQLCTQIDLAAEALARMSSIPCDFRDDLYWPRVW